MVHWYVLEHGVDEVEVWQRRKVKSEDRDQREGKYYGEEKKKEKIIKKCVDEEKRDKGKIK